MKMLSYKQAEVLEAPAAAELSLKAAADFMLHELETQRLTVVLMPSCFPEIALRGGKVRSVQERNPQWYQDFCNAYAANRSRPRRTMKHDTLIKRSHTLRALQEIRDTGAAETLYARRLIPYVKDYAAGWYWRR